MSCVPDAEPWKHALKDPGETDLGGSGGEGSLDQDAGGGVSNSGGGAGTSTADAGATTVGGSSGSSSGSTGLGGTPDPNGGAGGETSAGQGSGATGDAGTGHGGTGDASQTGEGGAGGEGGAAEPYVRVCDALPTFAFVDGFESYSAGPLYDAGEAVWIRAEQSRTGQVTTTWARTGRHALELTSFSTSTETHYATLSLPGPTSRLVLKLVYTPDGFFVYKEFAMFGLARATSRFALTPLATFDGDDHELWFIDARGTRTLVHDEIEYSRLGDSPIDNHIRVEFDFCVAEASVFIGAGEEAPTLRATVPLPAAAEFDAFYVSGGVNPTFFDDIVIYTPGTEPDRSVLAP